MTKLPYMDDPDCIRHQPVELMGARGLAGMAEALRHAADGFAHASRLCRQQEKLDAWFKANKK